MILRDKPDKSWEQDKAGLKNKQGLLLPLENSLGMTQRPTPPQTLTPQDEDEVVGRSQQRQTGDSC